MELILRKKSLQDQFSYTQANLEKNYAMLCLRKCTDLLLLLFLGLCLRDGIAPTDNHSEATLGSTYLVNESGMNACAFLPFSCALLPIP